MLETTNYVNSSAPVRHQNHVMQSVQIVEPRVAKTIFTRIPEPGDNEIRIQIEGCGLSAAHIPIWEGREWFKYPYENGSPGNEGYGYVDKVGENVKHLKPGDRVAGISFKAFADFDIAKASEVIKLPETLKSMPFPGDSLSSAMNIIKRSNIQSGQHVAIIGVGFLGALLIQLLKEAGATVYAVSQREYSLEVASMLGADRTFLMDNIFTVEKKIQQLTNTKGCDCVIEATGKQAGLDLATSLVSMRGKIVIAGLHQDEARSVNIQTWNWKGIDVINAHDRDPKEFVKGAHEAIDAIASGKLNVASLFTHYYTPDKINEAFEAMVSRPDGFIKAIILFN
jgi:threonine dehydrogenase-like Zn-dependent dehydrogenase